MDYISLVITPNVNIIKKVYSCKELGHRKDYSTPKKVYFVPSSTATNQR